MDTAPCAVQLPCEFIALLREHFLSNSYIKRQETISPVHAHLHASFPIPANIHTPAIWPAVHATKTSSHKLKHAQQLNTLGFQRVGCNIPKNQSCKLFETDIRAPTESLMYPSFAVLVRHRPCRLNSLSWIPD